MKITEFGKELCKAMGIDPKTVTNIAVCHRVGCIPRVVVTHIIRDPAQMDRVCDVVRHFKLTPK